MAVTAIYRAIMIEVEARRISLGGIPQEKFSEWAGIAERSYAKYLHADAPGSGRQASWESLQRIVDALYPHGFDVVLRARPGPVISERDMKAKILQLREAANPQTYREKMREIGLKGASKGGQMRAKKLNSRARARIARKAIKTRWKKRRELMRQIEERGAEIAAMLPSEPLR